MLESILRAVAFALLAVSAAALSAASAVLKLCREDQTATREIPEEKSSRDDEPTNNGEELQDLIKEVQHYLKS